jgi:glucose-1-phosphatase
MVCYQPRKRTFSIGNAVESGIANLLPTVYPFDRSKSSSIFQNPMTHRRPDFFYFDLGNVLLYFDHRLAMRKMAQVAGVTADQMHSIVMDSDLQIEYETGHISGVAFIARISDAIGRELDAGDMLQAAADMFVPNNHILPALHRVKEMGIPIGLLSNTCEAHWNWIQELAYPQVVGWFDPVILSYEVKSMKPDGHIYREAQRLCGHEPSKIFFTDDREDNVAAAVQAGWQAEVFVNADRLMKTIDRWES